MSTNVAKGPQNFEDRLLGPGEGRNQYADLTRREFRKKERLHIEALITRSQIRRAGAHAPGWGIRRPHHATCRSRLIATRVLARRARTPSKPPIAPRARWKGRQGQFRGQVLIPGVLESKHHVNGTGADRERIGRYAKLVGRENVIAGSLRLRHWVGQAAVDPDACGQSGGEAGRGSRRRVGKSETTARRGGKHEQEYGR